jgi:hypothetical protein
VLPVVLGFFLLMVSAAMSDATQAVEYRRTITESRTKWIVRAISFFLAVFAIADGVIVAIPYVWGGYLRLLA